MMLRRLDKLATRKLVVDRRSDLDVGSKQAGSRIGLLVDIDDPAFGGLCIAVMLTESSPSIDRREKLLDGAQVISAGFGQFLSNNCELEIIGSGEGERCGKGDRTNLGGSY